MSRSWFPGSILVCIAALVATAEPPRGFQGGTHTPDPPCMPILGKITQATPDGEVVTIRWTTSGLQHFAPGERGLDGKDVYYSYLGTYATFRTENVTLRLAGGKQADLRELRKRLVEGLVVAVSMDAEPVAQEFLEVLKPDTIVMQVDGISLTERLDGASVK